MVPITPLCVVPIQRYRQLVSCAAFAYLACCYKQAQNDIVALQRKDALVFEQVLNCSKNVKSKSSENIDQLQTLLDKHQERRKYSVNAVLCA